WLRTVTVAPGSAAWLESRTCPLTVARNSCAATPLATASSNAVLSNAWYDFVLIIQRPPSAHQTSKRPRFRRRSSQALGQERHDRLNYSGKVIQPTPVCDKGVALSDKCVGLAVVAL